MISERDYVIAPDGVRLSYRVDGPVLAPAVLLCTMGATALSVWDSLCEPLARHWRTIRYDRRGDGDSDPGEKASHNFTTYARDGLTVLDHCGVDKAVICGMAFGARVAVQLAKDAPKRVQGLALFDATGGAPAPEPVRRAASEEARRRRLAAGLGDVRIERRWFQRRDPSAAAFAQHALRNLPKWTPGLEAINTPTLVACGDHDPNLEGSKRLAREIPGATFALMPMTGHASILDRPDLVLALLLVFLEQRCA